MRRRTYLATGVAAVVGGLAGCLGGDDGDGETTTAPAGPSGNGTDAGGGGTGTGGATAGGDATVTVATSEQYGEFLADAEGMALYLFTNDEGGESTCYDGCAETWPPLTVEGEPSAGEGVDADLGTTERRDGAMQVTAGGVPLYYYAPDESPGDTTGQGVGGVWFLLAPDGAAIEGEGGGGGDEGTTNGSGGGSDPY
ncbi:hypothetical protein [Halomarina rubra]|uniref:Lipoprotein with Yx(FWY)xxD motif n=1 Tax=Halomarina rubra TaxID=2071873 RepID=A0ABD6B0S2_9EURY|nr:hypothetical protein [Halomarina rubra]